jgi:Tfp pilus assembly protein PilO
MHNNFNEIYLSARMRYFFIFLVCTMIVIAGYWQDILPLRQELGRVKLQEQQLSMQLQKLSYQEISLEEKMGELPAAKSKLNEWQKKFIKQSDMDKLLKEIMAISKRDKLQIKFFNSGAVTEENNYVKQSFKMGLVGDYASVARFVDEVANLPWTVVVGDFSLTSLLLNKLYSTELEIYVYSLNKKS